MVFPAFLRDPGAVPDKLGGVLLMFGAIAILFILPWLDRSPVRSARFGVRIFFWLLFIDAIALGYLGGKPAEGICMTLSRVATAWYFLHFLVILPMLSVLKILNPYQNRSQNLCWQQQWQQNDACYFDNRHIGSLWRVMGSIGGGWR